ncbi:MAG: diaminopimelate epimerase [Halobacteriota archaeon]
MSTLHHTVPFEKYHGTGNDFLVVDADESVPDRGGFASTYCDRQTGVESERSDRRGADGVLFVDLTDRFSPPRVVMTLVQPDGSIAAMCGNGARVTAAWARQHTNADEFMIDTPAGTRHAKIGADSITIEMGEPTFDPTRVPLSDAYDEPLIDTDVEGLTVTAVNTGVPHAVAFVDDVDAIDLEAVAPSVRHADAFPRGTNVTIASPVDPDDPTAGYRQRTFERGVEGETRSCGTGAVAVVAAAKRTGRLDTNEPVTVAPPGGKLSITVPDRGPATLAGPVEYEFDGELAVIAPGE